jgi:hypothetical protein
LEAKQVGIVVYQLFAALDTKDDLRRSPFAASLLGQRLLAWSALPDHNAVHRMWVQQPRRYTFHWFLDLQDLLDIFRRWITSVHLMASRGFIDSYQSGGPYRVLVWSKFDAIIPQMEDTLLPVLERYTQRFSYKWFEVIHNPNAAEWSGPLPDEHFKSSGKRLGDPQPRESKRAAPSAPVGTESKSRTKPTGPPDFRCISPLFVPVETLPPGTHASLLIRRIDSSDPYPKLVDEQGHRSQLCFDATTATCGLSCHTHSCNNQRRRGQAAVSRLHICLSSEPWKSKPETYWSPIVQFLQQPAVRAHLLPSEAFKEATPSTTW